MSANLRPVHLAEPEKRGPSKGYITSLEKRLLETERMLLHLLPLVSGEQLEEACVRLANSRTMATGDGNGDQYQGEEGEANPMFGARDFAAYWKMVPLDSVERVREWQRDRESGVVASLRSAGVGSGEEGGRRSEDRDLMQSDMQYQAEEERQKTASVSVPWSSSIPRDGRELDFVDAEEEYNAQLPLVVPGGESPTLARAGNDVSNASSQQLGSFIVPPEFQKQFVW